MNDEITIHQEELERAPFRRRGSSGHWKRAFKWLGFTILVGVIAAAAWVFLTLQKISVNPFSFGHLKGEDRGRINIMMLGVGDPGHDGATLSDTNILLSIDSKNQSIAVISIPRDTRVKIPGYGSGKINTANAQGGISTARTVFEENLGVPVDYYVKANFTGLKQVVDAVGGIDVDNTTLLSDSEYPCDANQYRRCGYRLTPGKYHLAGAGALKYVRCRKGTCGDDFGRATRQQEVMQQIRTRATSAGTLSNPVAVAKLVQAAGDNISTDLSISNMMRLQEITKNVDKSNIFDIVFSLEDDGFLVTSSNSTDLLAKGGSFDDIQEFVQKIFVLGPIWSEHPKIIIQNGTETPGLAGKLQQTISSSGFNIKVVATANALTRDHAVSQVIDYTGGNSIHTASYLRGLLKLQNTTPPPVPIAHPPADFVITVGADYGARQSSQQPPTRGTSTSSSER